MKASKGCIFSVNSNNLFSNHQHTTTNTNKQQNTQTVDTIIVSTSLHNFSFQFGVEFWHVVIPLGLVEVAGHRTSQVILGYKCSRLGVVTSGARQLLSGFVTCQRPRLLVH